MPDNFVYILTSFSGLTLHSVYVEEYLPLILSCSAICYIWLARNIPTGTFLKCQSISDRFF